MVIYCLLRFYATDHSTGDHTIPHRMCGRSERSAFFFESRAHTAPLTFQSITDQTTPILIGISLLHLTQHGEYPKDVRVRKLLHLKPVLPKKKRKKNREQLLAFVQTNLRLENIVAKQKPLLKFSFFFIV